MDAAFIWALVATVMAGIQVFSQKVVAHERRDSAFNGVLGFGISALISGVAFVTVFEFPAQLTTVVLISAFSGILMCASAYYRIESLKHLDSVIYFPINKVLGPLAVVFIGIFFLQERLSAMQILGVLLSVSVPLLLISSSEEHRQRNLRLGLIFLVVSTVLAAITAPMQKVVTNHTSELFLPVFIWQTTAAIGSIFLYQLLQRQSLKRHVFDRRDLQLGFINGVLQFFSSFAFIKAISLGLVSIFYVIHAHYILIPIILSVLLYGDHVNMRKFAAIVVSLFAITLLAI